MITHSNLPETETPTSEIIFYQPDETIRIEVRMEDDTVWLTQAQIAELFTSSRTNILEHIKNIYDEKELCKDATCRKFRQVRIEGHRNVIRQIPFYNLDLIISVGYRIKSSTATRFRQWATELLKAHIFRHVSTPKGEEIARRLTEHDIKINLLENKFDLFIKTSLPPTEGIFYSGQVFNAYVFITSLLFL